MRLPIIAAALAIGAALSSPAHAAEALPPDVALQLDQQAVAFTMSAAAQRRHMMIEETMRQQQRQQRRERGGYGRGGDDRGGYERDRGRSGYDRPAYRRDRGFDGPGYGYRRY